MLNGFKLKAAIDEEVTTEDNEHAQLASKLERPSSGLTGKDYRLSTFTVTPKGVELHKGEELGMF